MAIYPDNLIPIKGYLKIEESSILECYLIRKTNIKDCFDSSTELLKDEVLFGEDKLLLSWSCSLFDNFIDDDFKNLIINKNYHALWDFTSTVTKPIIDIDFVINEDYGVYFLKSSEIKDITIPFDKMDGKNLVEKSSKIKIEHSPTLSNYWHFEIFWEDENQTTLKKSKSDWNNKLTSTIKAVIREYCIPLQEISSVKKIEELHYKEA